MKTFLTRLTALVLCLTLLSACALAEEALIAAPVLPDTAQYPNPDGFYGYDSPEGEEAYAAWRQEVSARAALADSIDTLLPFLTASAQSILTGSDGANRVYSPLSLYMALAMLAETTGGTTRAELLTLLGSEDVAALRQQASDLWNATYRDDGTMTRLLATSLWLNESVPFNQQTLQMLADSYYASAYRGKMGSPALNAALQQWLNDNTLGLLTDQVQTISLPADTLAAIASTVALSARWDKTFYADSTAPDVFHTPDGDVTCDFMHASGDDYIFWGERFTAAKLDFDMSGAMWLILPDEGVTPDDLLSDVEILPLLSGSGQPANSTYLRVNMSVPKFDVSSQLELSGALQLLGVTEVFDASAADFTPLTAAELPISLSQVRHDARVTIDEEGCKAAAYTVMILAGAAMPQDREEVDFVLDRPFLFVITGAGELPLFVGVVNHP